MNKSKIYRVHNKWSSNNRRSCRKIDRRIETSKVKIRFIDTGESTWIDESFLIEDPSFDAEDGIIRQKSEVKSPKGNVNMLNATELRLDVATSKPCFLVPEGMYDKSFEINDVAGECVMFFASSFEDFKKKINTMATDPTGIDDFHYAVYDNNFYKIKHVKMVDLTPVTGEGE